jgi:tetratricopeptide (TPR) repeat protein
MCSVVHSLKNLRWKVWMAASRTELNANNVTVAKQLLNRALEEVPNKTRAVVLIECARLEEFIGNLDKAREFLKRAKAEAKHEWKVFLESILLEMRAGEFDRAIEEAQSALQIHRRTGRLWAVLIQLMHIKGEDKQLKVLKEAIQEVPKSGEVWCEGARIRLNPLSSEFDLEKAKHHLEFAIRFTPQYGDSFIEYLRYEHLAKGPLMEADAKRIEQLCINADPNYGPLWFHCKNHPLDSTRQVLRNAKEMLIQEMLQYKSVYQRSIVRHQSLARKTVKESLPRNDPLFATGLPSLNLMYSNAKLKDVESRRKNIFGLSEQIV